VLREHNIFRKAQKCSKNAVTAGKQKCSEDTMTVREHKEIESSQKNVGGQMKKTRWRKEIQ